MTARVSPFGVDTGSQDGGGSPSPSLFGTGGICNFQHVCKHHAWQGLDSLAIPSCRGQKKCHMMFSKAGAFQHSCSSKTDCIGTSQTQKLTHSVDRSQLPSARKRELSSLGAICTNHRN
jgi:hypothetical protein